MTGQPLDFWRVEQVEAPSVLRLRAEMRMPGTAWLELSAVAAGPGRSTLVQRTAFAPWGPVGHAFWWAELPAHRVVYHRMLRALAAEAERRQGLRG